MRRRSPKLTALLLLSGVVLTGCATGAAMPPGASAPPSPDGGAPRRGVPGFDTREYPGHAAMAEWRRSSPYQWVGYYLESPCRPRSTWTGRRAALAEQGWGFAVLYVGEQQWSDTATHALTPGRPLRCSRVNLTAERGRADSADAVRAAGSDGFPTGTRIFLNVERVDSIGPGLAAYVGAWTKRMLESGSYEPALYAHAANVDALRALMIGEYNRRGLEAAPAVWVARSGSFDIEAAPSESGVSYAQVWQGQFNVDEVWGETRLRIDANVSDRASPSAPRQP